MKRSIHFIATLVASALTLSQSAKAHNLDTRATSISFADDYLQTIANRAGLNQQLIQVGDEFWMIAKTTPGPGTNTGVGGYQTFYVPAGFQVVDAASVTPSISDPRGFINIPMKGQSPIAIGDGPIGAKAAVGLTGFTYPSPNILGVNQAPVTAGGISRGTISGVYADTGIFYSTDARTAFNSYGAAISGGTPPMTNNSGDTVGEWDATNIAGTDILGVMTLWDSYQLRAFGRKDVAPIIDPADGRGNAPWGMASAVAGPESGYRWSFNHAAYTNTASIPGTIETGPWNRIKYPGSQVSKDQAGLISSALGYTGVDGSSIGYNFAASGPLPTNVNAVRFAIGQLQLGRAEYAAIKLKVNNVGALPTTKFYADAFGGDAGGPDTGKDHLWRYFDPTVVTLTLGATLQKVAADDLIPLNGQTSYTITFVNLGTVALPNVVLTDTLPSGLTYVGASPVPNNISGSNQSWNLGTVNPDQVRTITLFVKGTSVGTHVNTVVATSNGTQIAIANETVEVNSRPELRKDKTVTPSTVAPGDSVTYTVNVYNDGTAGSSTPLVVTDYLPPGFTYTSFVSATINGASTTPTVNSSNPAQPVFTFNQSIQADKTLTFKFVATTSLSITAGTYYNQTQVSSGIILLPPIPEAPVIVGGGRIGDFIWRDWNGDGVQDAGEEGISGLTVQLFAANGTTLLQTTATDANGMYVFTGLNAATYVVKVTPPASYTQTFDPDGTVNNETTVVLATDQQFLTADFGYLPAGNGSIGDFVFEDNNNNGVANVGDEGLENVTVNLYEDTNGNGIINAGDLLIATQSTNASGGYLFSGLATGLSYIAQVDQGDADLVTYFDPNSFQLSTPATKAVPNLAGANLTADFGFWAALPSSIGDTVFNDMNGNGIYDLGTDIPLANITVSLYRDTNCNSIADVGELFATDSTDFAGQYGFTGLGPDCYLVVVDGQDADLPGGLSPTISKIAIELGTGENITTADFPFVAALTKVVDRATAAAGDLLTYTIVPNYPGQALLTNARVTDLVPLGSLFSTVGQGGTHSAGTVTWNLGSNTPGIPGAGGAAAQSITLGDGAGETLRDTYIKQDMPNDNFGNDDELWIKPDATKVKRSIVQWNLSSIPAGATITGVSVQFHVRTAKAQTITLHRATSAWDEGTGTSSDGADWTKADDNPDVLWTTAGGDFDASSLGTFSAANTGPKTTTTSALKALVQAWVDGTTPNHGIFLTAAGAGGDSKLASSTNGTVAQRPLLIVSYLSPLVSPPAFTAVADTMFRQNDPTNNYGADADLFVRDDTDASADDRTAALRWDLSTIPSGAVITSASLRFYVNTAKDYTVGVAPLTQSFVEGQATWNISQTGTNWTTPGGTAGSQVGSFSTSATGYQTVTGANVLDMVQDWVDTPANNLGLRLKVAASSDTGDAKIDSRSEVNPPQLVLTYELASTNTTISTSTSLVGGSGPQSVTVKMDVSTMGNTVAKTVTAPTNLTPTGVGVGTIAKLSGPAPADVVIPIGGGMASFTWVYTVIPGANPGSVKFSGLASAPGLNLVSATSPSVLVIPPLTFTVTVGNPITTNSIVNVAVLRDDNVIPPTNSPPAITALTASIGDTVFADIDGNGVQDPSDPGLGGIEVCATNGVITLCDTTDGDGKYRIFGLAADTWTVTLNPATVPPGYLPTLIAAPVVLAATQQYDLADFGLRPPPQLSDASSIGDTVWIDANEDGIVDPSEAPIPNVTVNLYNDVGNDGTNDPGDLLILSTSTDGNGNYLFSGLYPGNYLVDVNESDLDFPISTVLVSGGANLAGLQDVALGVAQVYTAADFGYNYTGQIGDTVFYDPNINGVQNVGELGIEGVTIVLYRDLDSSGNVSIGDTVIQTTFSDANGNYLFDNLPPGKYVVKVDEQTVQSTPVSGIYGTMLATTGSSKAVELISPGSLVNLNADFGFVEGAEIEGIVFHDVNHSGGFDSGEPPLQPVTVWVYGPGVDGIIGTADDFADLIATTETGLDGGYSFLLPPGSYRVVYDTTDPQAQASVLTGVTTPLEYLFSVTAGQELSGFDFGRDHSGSVGDTVFADADGNGSKDVSELGLAGITVQLYSDAAFTDLIDLMATDANGLYLFEGLPDGIYYVQVDTATLPPNYNTTPTADPDVTKDSRGTALLTGGGAVLTMDFGYRYIPPTYAVSGTVYHDNGTGGATAGDSNQSGGEPGLPGVTVKAFVDTNNDMITDLTLTTMTAANGSYSFMGILQNSNVVVQVLTNTLPSTGFGQTEDPDITRDSQTTITNLTANVTDKDFGYRQVLAGVAGTVVRSADGDGLAEIGETPVSGVAVSLLYAGPDGIPGNSDDVVQNTVTDVNGDYSFAGLLPGFYQITKTNPIGFYGQADRDGGNPDVIELTIAMGNPLTGVADNKVDQDFEITTASFGDFVWMDMNGDGVQDATEPGLAGVRVYVDSIANGSYNVGEPTAVTNAAGAYMITGLAPGTYTVRVTNLPAGATATYDLDGVGTLNTTPVTLAANQDLMTVDWGYQGNSSIGDYVWYDVNGDGVQDVGEPALPNVTVFLDTDSNGLMDANEPRDITDGSGSYTFSGLVAGTYKVRVDPTTLPGGLTPSFDKDGIATANVATVTLPAATNLTDADFGYEGAATLTGHLYIDTNGDSDQDPGEPNLPNIDVIITISTGGTVTVSTDSNGDWTASVPPGSTSVNVDNADPQFPLGVTQTEGTDPTVVTAVAATNTSAGNDGYFPPATVTGHLYIDTNGDGDQDVGEPNLPNINVIITTSTGGTVTVSTDSNGDWTASVPPGSTSVNVDNADPQFPPGATQTEGTDPTVVNAVAASSTSAGNDGYFIPGSISGITQADTDLDGDGDIPVNNVTYYLLDGSGLPVDNPNLVGVQPYIIVSADGTYQFTNLPPGQFIVEQGQPAGYLSITDLDTTVDSVGSPVDPANVSSTDNRIPVNLAAGESDTGNSFVERLVCASSFAEWRIHNTLGGQNGNAQNPDGDIYTNVLEYAFCMPPTSGKNNAFCLQPSANGPYEIMFTRVLGGLTDTIYCIRSIADLAQSPGGWSEVSLAALGGAVTVTPNADGYSETVVVANVASLLPPGSKRGFFQIGVKLDSNDDDVIDVTDYTEVQGFQFVDIESGECETYSTPFIDKPVYSGVINNVAGLVMSVAENINFAAGAGVLATGSSYRVEIISGAFNGQRFEIGSGAVQSLTIENDADECSGAPYASYNTTGGLPAGLIGANFVIVRDRTINDMVPVTQLVGTNSSTTADRILFPNSSGGWAQYWVLQPAMGAAYWVKSGNGIINQNDTTLSADQAFFIHPRSGAKTIASYGMVRSYNFASPLCIGTQLVASGYPLDMSPANFTYTPALFLGTRSSHSSEQILMWTRDGFSPTDIDGYMGYWLYETISQGKWLKVGETNLTAYDNAPLVRTGRGHFFRALIDHRQHVVTRPWTPAVRSSNGDAP